jgi:hypothetical protein
MLFQQGPAAFYGPLYHIECPINILIGWIFSVVILATQAPHDSFQPSMWKHLPYICDHPDDPTMNRASILDPN